MGIFKKFKNLLEGVQKPSLSNEIKKRPEPLTMPDKSLIGGVPLAYHYKIVNVCIIDGNKPDFSKLSPNMVVTFFPEPTNPYDPNAVKVVAVEGYIHIGYLYKGSLQQMTLDFLRRGEIIKSYVTLVDKEHEKVTITIGFYKDKAGISDLDYDRLIEKNAPYKTFKLTGNRNEDMQDSIASCSEGEEVSYEFDDDKEKYVAICGDEIGYFPKSAEKYLEEEHPAFIESINEDDNDKYVVTISVFYQN